MEEKILNKYNELINKIKEHNNLYYNEDKPIISDYEYDMLQNELQEIERKYPELKKDNSPSELIGGIAGQKFSKVAHKVKMLSLSNTYNINEIKDFDIRNKKILENTDEVIDYILELKLDGLSISCIYEDGILVRGVTRGDGEIGEDVTENIMQIESIPRKLPKKVSLEVRGEIVFPVSKFNELNILREEQGEEVFANPRNAAAGTMRQLDSSMIKERGLDCYLYNLVNANNYGIETHLDSIEYIESLGFKTTKIFEIYNDFNKLEKAIEYWEHEREKLDYETDGLVIKINKFEYYEQLGMTTKSPRWAIAYKFKAQQVETKVLDITFQVGRTGVITPVAEFEAVEVSGSIVKRASLHNFDEIQRKDIRIGDTVIIEKAAEIIPQVVKVEFEKRDGNEKKLEILTKCPSCGQELYKEQYQVALKCLNEYCPEKIKREIEYFVSRDAMNISGLGEKIVEKLILESKINKIEDIYYISRYRVELENMEKMGKKSVDNLIKNVEESKNRDFTKVIYALGIPYVGKYTANLLVKEYKNIETIKNKTVDELQQVKGIGKKVAESVVEYLKNNKNWDQIIKLKELGLKFQVEELELEIEIEDNPIKGKKFLATGKLEHFKREEIKDIIIKKGGEYLSSVSKNLDYLIIGEKSGSKLEKANKLGIKILSEKEFLEEFIN